MDGMRPTLYFVGNKRDEEITVIRETKPERLLLSFFYFKNVPLDQFIAAIGYMPEIILDSGAYSAWTQGKDVALTAYIRYILMNRRYVKHIISLDVIGDPTIGFIYWKALKAKGIDAVPVYHIQDDVKWLDKYVTEGAPYIGLGGAAQIRDKAQVKQWAKECLDRHPDRRFHLLGASSLKCLELGAEYGDRITFDSATWILKAANGKPKNITHPDRKQAKILRAMHNIRKQMEASS